MKITGVAKYLDIEGGFWGIEANGSKYTPINMPEQLKQEGAKVFITAELLKDAHSITGWGEVIRIRGFETIG